MALSTVAYTSFGMPSTTRAWSLNSEAFRLLFLALPPATAPHKYETRHFHPIRACSDALHAIARGVPTSQLTAPLAQYLSNKAAQEVVINLRHHVEEAIGVLGGLLGLWNVTEDD